MANSIINTNPWKGLNFYVEGEVLYGRNSEIESLSQFIINNTQTVLYGKSGIGKSSILNAGIFPIARLNGLIPVGIRLDHNSDLSYLKQIKNAIIANGVDVHEIVPAIVGDTETLWEYMHRNIFFDKEGNRRQLLLVLDQFEEIFTIQKDEKRKRAFFDDLAGLLNDVTPLYIVNANKKKEDDNSESVAVEVSDSLEDFDIDLDMNDVITESSTKYLQKIDYHIVFTLREDFLSYLERYTAYIPVMKTNRYALLPINEEQAAEIIMKPREGLVSKKVAELIIQKVTGQDNFKLDGIPELDVDAAILSLYLSRLFIKKGDAPTITADLVNQFSKDIIKEFYTESVSDLPVAEIEKIEDQLLTYDGRRNNVSRNDLVREGISEGVIRTLVEDRKLLRQFSYQDDIRVEFMHDILCPVVDARIDQRDEAKRQEEEKARQEAERQKLLQQQKEELERMEEKARRQRKRNRFRMAASFALLAIVLIGWLVWAFFYRMEFMESYATFTTKNGWPVGVGEKLGNSEKHQMAVYYQLVRYGYNSNVTRVNVLNSQKDSTRNKFIESPLVGLYETEGDDENAKAFAQLQRQVVYWVYTPDNEGNVSRKTAYGMNGEELFAVQFFRASAQTVDGSTVEPQKKQLWGNYVDKDGKSMRVRDNGADRVRIIMNDSTGYFVGYQFYSETGTPQPNHIGVFGYRFVIDDKGRLVRRSSVDAFGDEIPGKTISYSDHDQFGRWIKSSGGTASYSKDLIVFAMANRTDSLMFGERGQLKYHSETMSNCSSRYFYYDKGKVTKTAHYRGTGSQRELYYERVVLPQRDPSVVETRVFRADSAMQYRIKREVSRPGKSEIAYFGGHSPSAVNTPLTITTSEGSYHKIRVDTIMEKNLRKVTKDYLDISNAPSAQCENNRVIAYYDANFNMVKYKAYQDGVLRLAYLYEYDNGQIVSQSVLGIDDSTAVRNPGLDVNDFCYYKMRLVYNFSHTLVAVKGVNEFGEESLITIGNQEYLLNVVPSYSMSVRKDSFEMHGLQVYRESVLPVDMHRKVEYICIRSIAGTWYKAGIRDGDLLISEGDLIKIARPDIKKNSYIVKEFLVEKGNSGAEHYPVYFKAQEMARYNNAIR